MNKVILIGRLTKDPEIKYAGELAISSTNLAVDRKYKKDEEPTADFINCKAFGKTAEWQEKYLRKGTKICIEGRIQTGSYTNKDGNKVYTTEVIVESQEFVESKYSNEEPAPKTEPTTTDDGFMNIPDGLENELPFN